MAAQTTVVIIGGSYGGLGVAHAVLKGIPDVKVVLINPSDYLVIASGSSTKATQGTGSALAPFKTTGSDDIETDIKNIQEKLSRAKSIVIAGAGPVGVEFAAEVAEAFKDKTGTSITLV